MQGSWGLLGPEWLPKVRRSRGLGLGASVRAFNELAVPGLGGVWYGRQLLLATLGVAVAEEARRHGARVQNLETANALEALACWLAFAGNGWLRDARLRGRTRLQSASDLSFHRARQRGFYVTQPMRMACVQALPALGLVAADSPRFNAFGLTEAGRQLIEAATAGYRPYRRSLLEHLTLWALSQEDRMSSAALSSALSPLQPMQAHLARVLRERLLQGGQETEDCRQRRGQALAWMERVRRQPQTVWTWAERPAEIEPGHWHDLQAGAGFFALRTAAIAALDAAEIWLGNLRSARVLDLLQPLPEPVLNALQEVQAAAQAYLVLGHPDEEARLFAAQCRLPDPAQRLRALVQRDGLVLRLVGAQVRPGAAFSGLPSGSAQSEETAPDSSPESFLDSAPQSAQDASLHLPPGISGRMRNLYLFNLDLHGELDAWLQAEEEGDEP